MRSLVFLGRGFASLLRPAVLLSGLFLLQSLPYAYSATPLTRPLPGAISLDFNAAYAAGDQTRYHTGVDISGRPGERVAAAAGGQVTFSGRVPRPAGDGPPVLAATVRLDDGRLTTYLPFDKLDVSKGNIIAQGASIGILAAEGDGSSGATHLHFGVRENGNYVDPKPLPVSVPPARSPAPRTSQSPERRPVRTAAPAGPLGVAHSALNPGILGPVGARSAALARNATRSRGVRTGESASQGSGGQAWLHTLLRRGNRARPWLDPRLIELVSGPAARSSNVVPATPEAPRVRMRPLELLLLSGALFAASSMLGLTERHTASSPAPIRAGSECSHA